MDTQNCADNFFRALPFLESSCTTSSMMLRPSLLRKVSIIALSNPWSSSLDLMARSACSSKSRRFERTRGVVTVLSSQAGLTLGGGEETGEEETFEALATVLAFAFATGRFLCACCLAFALAGFFLAAMLAWDKSGIWPLSSVV